MPGALDIVVRLRTELPTAGVPISTLASLTNISGSKLTAFINGSMNCPGDVSIRLSDVWRELQHLIQAVDPLVLNYHRVQMLRECMQLMREGQLRVIVFDPTTPLEHTQDFLNSSN
jgi:hypothetical protein